MNTPAMATRSLRARLRTFLLRLAGPVLPRIGRLRHHPPRPLLVPAAYLSDTAPDPPPGISIVTPTYQQARYLERAVRSVAAQGYPALEYVVQDGGSTDDSPAILQRLSGLLTSWASEKDDGQADAINRGFRRTTGEIMAWLNSDDMFLPGALNYVARHFVDHPEVDVVYGDRALIDENDMEIGVWMLPEHEDAVLTVADYVPQETLFWRRSIWEAAGARLDPSFHFALDWDLLLRFRDVGAEIVHVPRLLGAFRVHDQQKTTGLQSLGVEECARLRRRVHGRDLSADEIMKVTRAYHRRHLFAHGRFRFRERVQRTEMVAIRGSYAQRTT